MSTLIDLFCTGVPPRLTAVADLDDLRATKEQALLYYPEEVYPPAYPALRALYPGLNFIKVEEYKELASSICEFHDKLRLMLGVEEIITFNRIIYYAAIAPKTKENVESVFRLLDQLGFCVVVCTSWDPVPSITPTTLVVLDEEVHSLHEIFRTTCCLPSRDGFCGLARDTQRLSSLLPKYPHIHAK